MSTPSNAEILESVLTKMRSGGKIEPAEFKAFVKAQNDGLQTGPEVGAKVPDFELVDQQGKSRGLRDLTGSNGLLLVFTRSADW